MSPRAHDQHRDAEDELTRARTITMAQGPGFMMKQVTDVIMDETTAGSLRDIMMYHEVEENQVKLKSGIEQVASAVAQLTQVMGSAIGQVASRAHDSDQKIIAELQSWTQGQDSRVNELTQELKKIPKQEDILERVRQEVETTIPRADAIQELVKKTMAEVIESHEKKFHDLEKEIRERAMQGTNECIQNAHQEFTEIRKGLSQLAAEIQGKTNALQEEWKQYPQKLDVLEATVKSVADHIGSLGGQVGEISFELGGKFVNYGDLEALVKEIKTKVDHALGQQDDRHEALEQEAEQLKAILEIVQEKRPFTPDRGLEPQRFDIGTDPMRTVPPTPQASWDGLLRTDEGMGAGMKMPATPMGPPGLTPMEAQGFVGYPSYPGLPEVPRAGPGFAGSPGCPTPPGPPPPGTGWTFAERQGPTTPPRSRAEPVTYRPPATPDTELPRFGLAGLSTTGDWTEFRSVERKLSELPKLAIPSGEACERNMVLHTWQKEVVLAATTVSVGFSDFVLRVMEKVKERYIYQKSNPRSVLPRCDPPPENLRDYNSKLCVLLLPSVPEEVKQKVLEDVDETIQLTAVSILDEVWNYVAPGGQEELEGLTRYIRNPGGANTAEEARKAIRMWMQARRRAVVMKIPDLSPLEQMKALDKLIREVEKKHGDFAHRVSQMKYAREGRLPTDEFILQYQSLIEEELRLVESDEMVLKTGRRGV